MADNSTKAARPTEATVRARMAEAGIAFFPGAESGAEPVAASTEGATKDIPASPADVSATADISGVLANLIVLQDHVATLRGFALDARSASAMRFEA